MGCGDALLVSRKRCGLLLKGRKVEDGQKPQLYCYYIQKNFCVIH
jgi:hypothetical protein